MGNSDSTVKTETPPYSEILFYTISCTVGAGDDPVAKMARDKVVSYEGTFKPPEGATRTCSQLLTSEYINTRIRDRNRYWPDGVLYTPGQFQARTYDATNNPGNTRVGSAIFQTKDDQYALNRMPACCQTGTCQANKCFTPVKPNCIAWIWPGTGTDNRIQWIGPCSACTQIDCGNTCANGEYADAYTQLDSITGLRVPSVVCTACPRGTFNTCRNNKNCTW